MKHETSKNFGIPEVLLIWYGLQMVRAGTIQDFIEFMTNIIDLWLNIHCV